MIFSLIAICSGAALLACVALGFRAIARACDADHDEPPFEPTPEMLRSVSQAEAEARGWI